jgi:hypothetical protein
MEAERGCLGCVLAASSERDADAMLEALRPALFYDLRHQKILQKCRELRAAHRAVDLVTLTGSIGGNAAEVGGMAYLQKMDPPSVANFPSYLDTLEEKATLRRALLLAGRLSSVVYEQSENLGARVREAMKEVGEDLTEPTKSERPVLLITDPDRISKHKLREDLCLVGDNEICRGYEGIACIAGPPGSGKSLSASALALSGAIGKGDWFARNVHRRYKTLMIQAENGTVRMKSEFEAMIRNNPGVRLSDWIRISHPPEGGLPFHRPEFRRAFRRSFEDFRPDLITLDPWTAVAVDDGASDVVQKLAEIRSCLPPGDDCPGIVIVCHTRKPKAEGIRRGRGLLNELSGSLALGSTARAVFVMLPFTDDIRDDRVLWSCAKLSNGEAKPDSVWHRRIGSNFAHCKDDPTEYWNRDERPERTAVSRDELREIYGERMALTREELVKGIVESEAAAYQTARRITGPEGYLLQRQWIKTTPTGSLAICR